MALMVLIILAVFSSALHILAVPLGGNNTAIPAFSNTAIPSPSWGVPSATISMNPGAGWTSSQSALVLGSVTTSLVSTVTLSTSTVTVTGSPQTVTDTITLIPPPAPSSPSTSPNVTSTTRITTWSAPPQMTDLSSFSIQHFADGLQNMRIIVSDPPMPDEVSQAQASSPTPSQLDPVGLRLKEAVLAVVSAVTSGLVPPPPLTLNSFIQIFYPAKSINPHQDPEGGAEFYATPLDLKDAKNVSLEYSVFFPSDFDWVQAGKLPGLYGGHDRCSGGNDAVSCFSTRLMWRGGGLGELYLYAPKDKQTPELCETPPQSVCDADYGLSIGRGSFSFAAGNWTHVKQTVVLNTPGQQDGAFALDVNGVRVIDRSDVFYRDVPGATDGDDNDSDDEDLLFRAPPGMPNRRELYYAKESDSSMSLTVSIRRSIFPDGSEIKGTAAHLHPLVLRDFEPFFSPTSSLAPWIAGSSSGIETISPTPPSPIPAPTTAGLLSEVVQIASSSAASLPSPSLLTVTEIGTVTVVPPPQTVSVTPTSTVTAYVVAAQSGEPVPRVEMKAAEPVQFIGLFFSTFFGGHEEKYATPKDQFTWFKDFAMSING